MTKKIIAAMLALTMCTSLAGCEKASEKKDSSSAKDKANTASADTDTTNDENTQAPDSNTSDSEDTTVELNKDNIFINDVYVNNTDTPTNDELLTFATLAIKQYNAAQKNDSEKYTQMLAFDKVVEPFSEMIAERHIDPETDKMSVKDMAMYRWGYALYFWSDVDPTDDDAGTEEFKKRTYLALDGLNIDKTPLWETRKDLVPMGEVNADTIAYIDLQQFVREEDDMYINFDMTLLNGNDMFKLGSIEAWYIDGSSGVMIFSAEHSDNEYAGMTIDEIKQKIGEKKALNNSIEAASSVYFIMAEYCADRDAEGKNIKKILESDFPMCNSGEGLDIAGDEPKAEGDKYVYNEMHEYGYTDGKASISGYDKDLDFIEKAGYTSTDGVTGYYPTEE
ncbi:hypothetical protein RASY3_12230 [Ruminococcus albus SY3]|uniref:Uncharacterized protein n=1 Tax=Ruminococcus albus SY3 TaxID=1341156 RepID=A0A011WQ89_RUMAL|nr:hypothetical protein [Ruminococcus albus]EXM39175.1 hypothetical protein RASY3_12230 [Ruminococcus albus SY3]